MGVTVVYKDSVVIFLQAGKSRASGSAGIDTQPERAEHGSVATE